MAKFLLTWELGGAYGHLAALRTLAAPLLARGHSVALALRDRRQADEFFPALDARDAPIRDVVAQGAIAEPSTFADILSNAGWAEEESLARLVSEWRLLFDDIKPDVVVSNYAPTSIVAAQGLRVRSVVFGTGFYSPPDISPLPDLCPWRNNYPDRLLMTERRVLTVLNGQLARQGVPSVERVTQLYVRPDANLLTTYREMDHYQGRQDGDYIGPWGELPGKAPVWPEGVGPRVFAYLKPMESLAYLLDRLRQRGWPTLIYAPSASQVTALFACETLYVADSPLDIQRVAATCDFAILNAGHNATLRLLLSGKPILALPLSGEQHLVAENVKRMGAGLSASHNGPAAAVACLERVSTDRRLRQKAEQFAARYADIEETDVVADLVERLESLV